ncbi:hypothetical protein EDD17DRAFT_1666242, partial [Pisolithus thermaeus]
KFAVSKVTFECAIQSTWVPNKRIARFLDGRTTVALAFGLHAFVLLIIHMIHAKDLLLGRGWLATHQQRKILGNSTHDHQGRHAELPFGCIVGMRDVDNIMEILKRRSTEQYSELPLRTHSIRNYSLIRWDKILFVRGVQSGLASLARRGLHPRAGMEPDQI